ncbi:MAG TPA: PAP2 family protein, partial [Methanobacterium sp.]|nr:PAP2 family protein [Methanobacterium sp.]
MSYLTLSYTIKKNIAELISLITYAPLVSIPAFAVINYSLDGNSFVIITFISIFFAADYWIFDIIR